MKAVRSCCDAIRVGLSGRVLLGLLLALAAFGVECAPVVEASADASPDLIRNYGPADGFSQNAVNVIVQGRDGYLWLGTFGGLVRFDGDKFTTLRARRDNLQPQDPSQDGGLGSDRIVALREDSRGRLWIGTEDGGLSLYHRGKFQQLPMCGGTCGVRTLSPQVGNTLWAATTVGVFRVSTDTLQTVAVAATLGGPFSEVAVGSDGAAYLSGDLVGLMKVVGDTLVPVPLPQGVKATWQMRAAGKYLWLRTNLGLYRFDPASQAWSMGLSDPGARPLPSPDGQLWTVTTSGVLLHADAAGVLRPIPGLPTMYVMAVWRDRAGVMWVGSGDMGLWSIEQNRAKLVEYGQHGTTAYAKGGRAVVDDGAGGTWLGYACGGIRHRHADGSYEVLSADVADSAQCISSLLRDHQGDLWVAGVSNGARRISGGEVEPVFGSELLAGLQLWQAADGARWLAAEGSTYRLQKGADGRFELSPPIPALEGMTIRKLIAARKGGVWLAGNHGVVRLQNDRIVERWTPAQGLSSRFARAVYEDAKGVLWVGTYGGGLNRIENGRVQHYDERNGLFDDTVSCILVDRSGQMWLGGNRGISVLPAASQLGLKLESVPFAVSSGSVSFELNGGNQSACHQDPRGHLWFALVKGFAEIDPARLVEISSLQPQVHIERVSSNGRRFDPLKTVVLDASSQLLEIRYTGINLTRPQELSFRYRISGSDAWTDAGTTRSVIFQDVPWGDQVFEVQARNRGGSWSPVASLRISRPMPWYQRQWLWPLLALLALLAVMWRTRELSDPGKHQERLKRIATKGRPR